MTDDDKVKLDGDGSPRLVIDGTDAMNECIERLFLGCRRSLLVRAKRLDFDFYFSDTFTECCQSIVTRSMRNELLFLVEDEQYLMKINARLVALARQLSTYIKLKVIPEEYIERNEMFIVQDDGGYLHQHNTDYPRGILDTGDRGTAGRLARQFRDTWERSFQPPELFVTGL